eukprot:Skav228219  [mRNA]  locus=scaffold43:211728:224090:+ [translate_table: standard]
MTSSYFASLGAGSHGLRSRFFSAFTASNGVLPSTSLCMRLGRHLGSFSRSCTRSLRPAAEKWCRAVAPRRSVAFTASSGLAKNILSISSCLAAICLRFTASLSPISIVKESVPLRHISAVVPSLGLRRLSSSVSCCSSHMAKSTATASVRLAAQWSRPHSSLMSRSRCDNNNLIMSTLAKRAAVLIGQLAWTSRSLCSKIAATNSTLSLLCSTMLDKML